MATRIRLRRVGRKKQASFRIVVAGSMHARSGRMTESIGKYNPRTRPSYVEIDEPRALHWLRQGAKMSPSVESLFRQGGILKKFADGAEGEGIVRIGDPQGKTIHPPDPSKKKAAAPTEAKAAEAETPAEAKPEAEAEAEAPSAEEETAEKVEEAEASAADPPESEASEPEEAEAEEDEEK